MTIKKDINFVWDWQIIINWIKTHNLKNIDITIPKHKIVTITWVSGSGKSSLAFDTIYKEWQFRYIESLSSYLRQFFNLWERPDIEYCEWLSPAVAIEQNKKMWNSRSTVGTLTEIDDYLRLLFAKLWDTYCYGCGKEIKPQSIEQIISTIQKEFLEKKIYLLQDITSFQTSSDLKEFSKKNRNRIEKWKGFTRYLLMSKNSDLVDWSMDPIEYFYLEEPNIPAKYFPVQAFGIYDRVTVEKSKISRLKEDIIKILAESNKFGIFLFDEQENPTINRFTDKIFCPDCNIAYPEMTPQNFSPNRQEWACQNCHWLWEVLQADLEKIIDPESPYIKAVLPRRDSMYWQAVLKKLAIKYDISETMKRKELEPRFQNVVIEWDKEVLRVNLWWKHSSVKYEWIESILKEQFAKWLLTVDFQSMLNMKSCPICNWAKLRKESLYSFLTIPESKLKWTFFTNYQNFIEKSVKSKQLETAIPVNNKILKMNIQDLHEINLEHLTEFLWLFQKNTLRDKKLVEKISFPLLDRTSTIQDLGLGYITLFRQIWTLSGWEVQRLRLAKQLWNKLTGIIYVLDEPTIGLSSKEIQKTITSIQKLQQMWNSVIVVEHNEEFIKASDWIIEIWPRSGDFGWEVVFNWDYQSFLKSKCLTAQYITWKKKIHINFEHKVSNKEISIYKASKYNLDNIDVKIKLWSFTVVTWPSWAWKTTLMYSTLFRFLNDKQKFVQSFIRFQLLKLWRDRQKIITAPVLEKEQYYHYQALALQEFYKELWVDTIRGYEEIKNIIYVDQTSIWKTPRSCPATFIKTFDRVRQLYAGTQEAKYLWFNSGHFSFNSDKGACPACKGYWYKKVELQFLPDTYIHCELCNGKRYKSEILDIKRHWKTVSEVLDMYIIDALELFGDIGSIKEELQLMTDIGLWYLRMGQPAHTLSGGESQRLKLIKHLLKSYTGHTVYFLDEPTVWLHPEDIWKLLLVLKKFLDNGDTILMIEHDPNIISFADQVIELDNWKIKK